MITMKQMIYFSAVCRHMNMTKAAEELYISQPALSLAMKELERETGYRLFEKNGGRIQLTETGKILLDEIQPVLDQMDQLSEKIRTHQLARQYVRFGFSSIVGVTAAPKLCQEFVKEYPEITLRISEDIGRNLLQKLNDGQLDAVLTGGNYAGMPEWKDKFKTLDIFYSPMIFCVGKEHPLSGHTSVSLEEIASYPLCAMNASNPLQKMIENCFLENNIFLNVVLRSFQLFTLEQFIANSYMAGFLPVKAARQNSNIVPLYCHELDDKINIDVRLYWKREIPAVRSFVRCAKNKLVSP